MPGHRLPADPTRLRGRPVVFEISRITRVKSNGRSLRPTEYFSGSKKKNVSNQNGLPNEPSRSRVSRPTTRRHVHDDIPEEPTKRRRLRRCYSLNGFEIARPRAGVRKTPMRKTRRIKRQGTRSNREFLSITRTLADKRQHRMPLTAAIIRCIQLLEFKNETQKLRSAENIRVFRVLACLETLVNSQNVLRTYMFAATYAETLN